MSKNQRSITSFFGDGANKKAKIEKAAEAVEAKSRHDSEENIASGSKPASEFKSAEPNTIKAESTTMKSTESKAAIGEPLPYSSLCAVFSQIEATQKRLEITSILHNFLQKTIKTHPNSLLKAVYLCLNKTCPDYIGKELGIGESLIVKSIEKCSGASMAEIKKECNTKGDLGQVAHASASSNQGLA